MKDCIPKEMQERIEGIGQEVTKELAELCERMLEKEGDSLKNVEERIGDIMKRAGLGGMEVVVGEMERSRKKGQACCPKCGQKKYWKHYVKRQCISTLGEFQIERAYYYCGECGAGWCPWDQILGLGSSELSPEAEEIAGYLGAFMPFRRAADFLERSHLLNISHDTVNNATVRVGKMLSEKQQSEVEAVWSGEQAYPVYEGADLPEALYLSGDGVRYLASNGQGKELKVAAVYKTEMRSSKQGEKVPHALEVDYIVSSQKPQQFTNAVELVSQRRGLKLADKSVILQDGQIWLWQNLAPLAGDKRIEIIDFYHAAGYVTDASAALFPAGQERDFWSGVLLSCLKAGQPELVTDTLSNLLSSPDPLLADVQAACDYLSNYAQRMAYDQYQADGLQIASGTIESGVKQVASDRLKQAGMRWNPVHAEAVSQVRAAILSHRPRWDNFWQDYHPPARSYQRHSQAA